jgi:hypothetical protein
VRSAGMTSSRSRRRSRGFSRGRPATSRKRLWLAGCIVTAAAIAVLAAVALYPTTPANAAAAALPSAVAKTFPLGIGGVRANRDGTFTLWVMNTQTENLVVNGTNVFSADDVVLGGRPGSTLKIVKGTYCSVTSATSDNAIECLPAIAPKQLVPVVTFKASAGYELDASSTIELSSASEATAAVNARIPASARTATAIRAYLSRVFQAGHRQSTVVRVTAGRPVENGFILSPKSVRHGWVTFVATNRGNRYHSFAVCPNGGLVNQCSASQNGVTVSGEVNGTGSLAPGGTAYFTMDLPTPGTYEYLSDVIGQAQHGAKGDLTVSR